MAERVSAKRVLFPPAGVPVLVSDGHAPCLARLAFSSTKFPPDRVLGSHHNPITRVARVCAAPSFLWLPMITINVKTSFDQLAFKYRMFARDLPYATAQALNAVVFESQRTLRNDTLPGTFTLRNRRTQSGIVSDKATKQRLTATVGTRDWWTSEQTQDTTRRAGNEGRESIKVKGQPYLAIPVNGAPQKVVAKSQRASVLIAKGKAFVVRTKSGQFIVASRDPQSGRGLIPLYVLRPQVRIKNRLQMQPVVDKVITARFDAKLAVEFERIARKAGMM